MRKITNKAVSVILVVALCVSTLCGALIPASAAIAGNTYSVIGKPISSGERTTEVLVTFTSESGFTSGSFDLMFDDSILDKRDENGDPLQDVDTNVDGMISKYLYAPEIDEEGEATGLYTVKTDENGERIESGDIIYNSGSYLPNLYGEYYEETIVTDENGDTVYEEDGVTPKTKSVFVRNLSNTKIEIVDGTKADGTFKLSDFASGVDTSDYYDTVDASDERKFKVTFSEIYTEKQLSESRLDKYYRDYDSVLNVATDNLSYGFATVTEDANVINRNTLYAEGFKDIRFTTGDITYYSVTFKVTFDFTGRSDRPSAIGPSVVNSTVDGRFGNDNYIFHNYDYKLNVENIAIGTLSDFSNISDNLVLDNDTKDEKDANGFHVHRYYTDKNVKDYNISADGIGIGTGKCGFCNHNATMMAVADEENGVNYNDSGYYWFNGYRSIYGANIVYQNDGTLSFNLHFTNGEIADERLIIADENGNLLKYSDSITSNSKYKHTKSFLADRTDNLDDEFAITEKRELTRGATMITINGLSAKDINKKLYISRYTPDKSASGGETAQMGRTYEFSLGDYCESVINEENVYYITADGTKIDLTTDESAAEQITADKAVAATLINYGDAAAEVLAANNTVSKTDIVYYQTLGNGIAPTVGSGTKEDPFIISTVENLLYIVSNGIETTQKYYKVADNVKAFVLQSSDTVEKAGGVTKLMNLTEEGVMEWFDDPNKKVTYKENNGWGGLSASKTVNGVTWMNWNVTANSTTPFMGYFDGNGVTIYGMYNQGSKSLFGTLKDATIKNVNVKSSYVIGYQGGLIADSAIGGVEYKNNIENCSVINCVSLSARQIGNATATVSSSSVYKNQGVLVGPMNGALLNINNCFVSDAIAYNFGYDRTDDTDATTGAGQSVTVGDSYYYSENGWKTKGNTLSMLGTFYNSNTAGEESNVSNTISLSVYTHLSPYANWDNNGGKLAWFSNCYTDKPTTAENGLAFANDDTISYSANQIAQINPDNLMGSAAITTCSNLDWKNSWVINNFAYPTPVQSGINIVEDKTIYWCGDNGSESEATLNDTGAAGTSWDDPIIIDNAEELHVLARTNITNRGTGNFYKIADGISTIILQPKDVIDNAGGAKALMSLTDVSDVQTFMENLSGKKDWSRIVYQNWFNGSFDGNGVTIYGLYSATTDVAAGLFPYVDGGGANSTTEFDALNGSTFANKAKLDYDEGIVIKGVTIKNSYMNNNDRMGAIAGRTCSARYGGYVNGTVNIEQCGVVNCYMRCSGARNYSGVIFGNPDGGDVFRIKNCYVSGNDAVNTCEGDNQMTLFGCSQTVFTGLKASGDYIVPCTSTSDTPIDGSTNTLIDALVSNTISLGTIPHYMVQNSARGCGSNVYENVFTDSCLVNDSGKAYVTFDTATYNYAATDIAPITATDLIGENAKTVINEANFNDGSKFWAENGGVWYVGNRFTYPSFSESENSLPYELQAAYNALDNEIIYDDYGVSNTEFGMYITSLNLKANPYMAFTFAFHQEYKDNRDQISVRFETSTDGTNYTTTKKVNVTNADGSLADGWVNNDGAGRYHLYNYKDINIGSLAYGIKVYATYGSQAEQYLGTFSVGGFALNVADSHKKAPREYTEKCYEAAKALLAYAQAINVRYDA